MTGLRLLLAFIERTRCVSPMSLANFLNELFEHGRVRVSPISPKIPPNEIAAADQLLATAERHTRLEFPGAAPDFVPSAARWAAERMFRACQLAVHREATIDVLAKAGPAEPELA